MPTLMPLTNRSLRSYLLLFVLTALLATIGCESVDREDVYRESKGQVEEVLVGVSDPYLRVAVFVRLKNGDIQYPYLYYNQGHFTSTGFRNVEKPGRSFTIIVPRKPYLRVPVGEHINEYILLISKPLPVDELLPEVKDRPTAWSEWHMYRLPSDEQAGEIGTITVPSFDELQNVSDDDKSLLKQLKAMYDKSAATAEERAAKPIRSGEDVPEYAR